MNQIILITGGSSGIGMALAQQFIKTKNEVIICGRREEPLKAMQAKYPSLHYRVADTGNSDEREALAKWVVREFPNLNVLINNAGIQRKVNLQQAEEWSQTASEIDINLGGPIHLTFLLIPHLKQQDNGHIVNVSSGLAFTPLAHLPIYCATKAALHSYTLSLRQQLRETSVKVTEIIPPAVKTNLGGSHDFGVELQEFAEAVIEQLNEGRPEITYADSNQMSQASRKQLDQMFQKMNSPGWSVGNI